jgi:predicted 3-demethylubiquinone-9 3-methyltransferase (glyoxalase superfamily)
MQKIITSLWFDTQSEEAANFYVDVFNGRPGTPAGESKILSIVHWGEAGPGEKGSVLTVDFQLDGVRFNAINGGPQFTFSEAVSLLVNCDGQEEVDYFWDAFTKEGEESQCGWLKDRYGLSWQIVPEGFERMLSDPNSAGASRAMEAMLKMKKLDLAELERAYAGS